MVFRPSPEIDEPSLGATKVNGHSLKALAFMQSRLDIWHVIILRYTTKVYCEKNFVKNILHPRAVHYLSALRN